MNNHTCCLCRAKTKEFYDEKRHFIIRIFPFEEKEVGKLLENKINIIQKLIYKAMIVIITGRINPKKCATWLRFRRADQLFKKVSTYDSVSNQMQCKKSFERFRIRLHMLKGHMRVALSSAKVKEYIEDINQEKDKIECRGHSIRRIIGKLTEMQVSYTLLTILSEFFLDGCNDASWRECCELWRSSWSGWVGC